MPDVEAGRSWESAGYLRSAESSGSAALRRDGPGLRLRREHAERKPLAVFAARAVVYEEISEQGIPNKGKLLTALSLFFFDLLANAPETKHIPNHVITSKLNEMPLEVQEYRDQLEGRAIWVKRAQVLPVEAIVRGYLTGPSFRDKEIGGNADGFLG